MALTKTDIVKRVQEQVQLRNRIRSRQQWLFPEMNRRWLSRNRARAIVDTLFETVKKTLASGEDVQISGFGRFRVTFRWARRGRNPQTGEMLILRSRRTVTFRPSGRLRRRINL